MTQKQTREERIRIRISSTHYDYKRSLIDCIDEMRRSVEALEGEGGTLSELPEDPTEAFSASHDDENCGECGEPIEVMTEGRMRSRGRLYEISYVEDPSLDPGETETTLVFSENTPQLLTLSRKGSVKMSLSFEEGRHHLGSYRMPMIPGATADGALPIAAYTRRLDNRLLTDGVLELDYVIEIRGMDAQRTVFTLTLDRVYDAPRALSGEADKRGK